jgi:hypothetical protein
VDDDQIVLTLHRAPTVESMRTNKISSEAMQSIKSTLSDMKEEEERRKKEEEENKKRQEKIRAGLNKSIMESSPKDLLGKYWNARSLVDRIL